MSKVQEYFAGTDMIDRFPLSDLPSTDQFHPFGYYQGILYTGKRGTSLQSIVTKDGIKGHTNGWKVPGRIYDQNKFIYFYKAPKRMTSFLRKLEQALSFTIPIIISPDWTIKIKDGGTFTIEDYNKKSVPKIRYSNKEGRIKLKDLLDEAVYTTAYAAGDVIRPKNVDPPIGSDDQPSVPHADELADSIKNYSKGNISTDNIKKQILQYKLLGGSLEGIFHVVHKILKPSIQKSTMRELQNYYLEGQRFSRSGWRRNDYRV